ncbi:MULTISPECIES: hypothetical protein, partial [Xanthobacter]|uniref:hypothetical protein n=1 Tax=Xanthobacter TaxID=279 RepID=UPI001AEEF050
LTGQFQLLSQKRPRKDSAVHVSLSSVIHVKQRALSGKFCLAEARASHPWEGPENTFPSGF